MDFELTEDQLALAEAIAAQCRGRLPLEKVRSLEGSARVVDPSDWAQLGEAGVFSVDVAEAAGGLGLGLADATVVFEQLGRHLVPGPLLGTAMAAGTVPGATEGARRVGLADAAVPGRITPCLVEHLADLDALLVRHRAGGHVDLRLLEDVEALRQAARPVPRPLDPLTPLWHVPGDLLAGGQAVEAAAVGTLLRRGAVLAAALQVGMAAATLDLAVDYAKGRRQFGRPIGGFQAVKHLCADMLVRAETARCAVQAAAVLVDQPDAARDEAESSGSRAEKVRDRAVAGAKLLADEAAVRNARTCIQVHGGMGFTWEVPAHLFLKRARVLATTFTTPAEAAETVAALM